VTNPLTAIERWRRRYHPLHQMRRVSAFRRIARHVDRPIWARLYGVSHPVRIYLLRNGSYLLNRHSPEPTIAALMLAILQTRRISTFWDIGANIGYYSWLVASASPSTRVLAVEPDPTNYALLQETRFHAPRVDTLNLAISREDGPATFLMDDVSGATGTLESNNESFNQTNYGERSHSLTVQTRSLDSLVMAAGTPDLIKIDVEGHETSVVEGAAQILASRPLILFETFDKSSRALTLLREAGYDILEADSLTEAISEDGNYLAIAAEQAALWPRVRDAQRRCLANIGLSMSASQ
jgi:FkbM family methyltransferase